jgi:hypothetical protein
MEEGFGRISKILIREVRIQGKLSVSTYDIGLIIRIDVLGDGAQGPGNRSTHRASTKKDGSPDSSHSDFGTLGILKEILEEFEEALQVFLESLDNSFQNTI